MPSITIDKQFFRKSLDDYNDWKTAQPRELLQNSVDCGSQNIEFTVEKDENGHVRLICQNDGPPMSEEVLVGKFMALGGTTKGTDGSVGGFGIAKLVIACAHQKYEIHTGDLVLSGEGGQYEIEHGEYISGTRTTVTLWDSYDVDVDLTVSRIKKVVANSDIKASIRINGQLYTKRMVVEGSPLQQFEFGNCYLVEDDSRSDRLYVRVNGLFMFEVYLNTKKAVILELTDSKKLTSNRDSLNWLCRDEVEKYINDLSINNETNLMVRVPEITEYGDFDIAHAFEELENLIESIEQKLEEAGNPDDGLSAPVQDDTPVQDDSIDTVESFQSGNPSQDIPNVDVLEFGDRSKDTRPVTGTIPAGSSVEYQNRHSVEQTAARASCTVADEQGAVSGGRKPMVPKRKMAKIVVLNHTRVQLPDYCIPGNLSKNMRKMVADWAGVCLAGAATLKIERRFSIGYCISDSAEALWMSTTCGDTLLVNPFEIVKIGEASWTLKNKTMTIEDMVPLAMHEITHMQLRSKYHDEAYASRLTDNMGVAYKNKKNLEKRAREISKIMYENFVW